MMNKAYLAGGVNQALVNREDGLYVLDGATQAAHKLDGYVFSQWRLSKQEITEVDFVQESEVFEQLFISSVQSSALQEALELMDNSFSSTYRKAISKILIERIEIHSGLLDYLTNRFYSNRLPEYFDENLAQAIIDKNESPLFELYVDLRKKTELFDIFYTRFWFALPLDEELRTRVDDLLTAESVFAHFTNALYTHSATLYDYAASLAIKSLEDCSVLVDRKFFTKLRSILTKHHKIRFRDTLPFEKLLRDHWMINVKPYRFFGSAIKTLYNFSHEHLPFSTEQTVQVLWDVHSPVRIHGEAPEEIQQKIYWQSINDLDFFSSIEAINRPMARMHMHRINEVSTCVKAIGKHDNHFGIFVSRFANSEPVKSYIDLVAADCIFLTQDFPNAISAYHELHTDIHRLWSKSRSYDHLMMNSNLMVRLGTSYAMINDFQKSKSYYSRALRMIRKFVEVTSVAEEKEVNAGDDTIYNEPTSVEYADAVASRLSEIIADQGNGAIIRI